MNDDRHASRNGFDDAELVRYLDGELPATERARVERDLAADTDLAARLHTLRRRGEKLRALLADDPVAAPPARPLPAHARPRTAWLRAATIILALAATALLVPPVRAWIAHGIARMTDGSDDAPAATNAAPASAASDDVALTVTLDVRGDTFGITIDRAQDEGSLIVRRPPHTSAPMDAATQASANLHGTTEDAELLVLPGVLHIRNREDARASYTVVLSDAVRFVAIQISEQMRLAPLDADSIVISLRRE